MTPETVRIGLIPSVRHGSDAPIPDWCAGLSHTARMVLPTVPGLELVAPTPAPDDERRLDANYGYTPYGTVYHLDHAEALAEYFARQHVDGLIIAALNFGDERSAVKIAEKLRLPVLLYATREPPALENASLARVSDSYCGTLSIASGLYRRKIPFHYAGIFFHNEPGFLAEVETFVRAVSVVKGSRNARIGQVGLRPATFETVAYDETAMIRKFGQNVIVCEVADVVRRAQSLADDDPLVSDKIKAMRSEVAEVSVSQEYLAKAAKMEIALSEFFTRNRLSAMAMHCWPSIQAQWGFSTCALFGRLTGQGMLTACEVDILGSLAMLANYRAALGQTPPHFIDWTIQHREDASQFLAWHCGNAPVCLADHPARTAIRSRHDMQGVEIAPPEDSQAGLYQFQIRPGVVTFCRLQEYDDQWKMLITCGEIIPSEETLAGTWAWVRVPEHARLYRTLVEEGFVHHASMIHGDQRAALALACKFLDIKPVMV